MSADGVEVVRRIHEAVRRGDSPRRLGLFAEDVEYVNPPDAVEPGTLHGIDAFERAFSDIDDTFDGVQIEVEEFVDVGERILVLARLRGHGRASGAAVDIRQGYVWTIRDGLAVRFQWFNDREQARAAAGLSPP